MSAGTPQEDVALLRRAHLAVWQRGLGNQVLPREHPDDCPACAALDRLEQRLARLEEKAEQDALDAFAMWQMGRESFRECFRRVRTETIRALAAAEPGERVG